MSEPINVYSGLAEETEKPFDVKYYFFLFKKNFYIILTFFVIAMTIGGIYVAKIPDEYSTVAQLMIERPLLSWKEGEPAEDSRSASLSLDYYSTQVEIMHGLVVLRQVAKELKLTDYYGIENEEMAALRIQGMIKVERLGDSRLFNIKVTTEEPQLAANIANAVARTYVRKNFENMLYYSKEVLTWLPLKKKKAGETITVEDPFGGVKQMTREELIESLPSIQTDPAIRSLREKKNFAESDLQTLLKQYREKHPVIIKARANIKFLDESIDSEKLRVIEGLKNQAEGRHRVSNARIIEEAKVPEGALPTSRVKILLMVALAELLLSFIIIGFFDYFDDTVRSVEDLERKGLSLPFLGPIPFLKGNKAWKQDAKAITAYYQKNSELAEAFRYLRVAINFSASPESLKTLVFTSCLPHEGKSFISHNIAISFAMDGNKTLLVDADLRRPVLHSLFKADNTTGLSNFLTSNISVESIVKPTFVENLFLVTSGPPSPNPGEILGSERMKIFLDEARKGYDRVIIDCPPLTGLGDSYVVGNLIGQIILIISSGKTPVDLIKHTQKQLEKTGVKIIGSVLSMVDLEKERYGGYSKYYYHTYTRYYQRDEKS